MVFKLLPDEPKPKKSKTELAENITRVPLVSATGALAAIPGFVGNIAKGINDLVASPITKAITGSSIPYEETTIGKLLPTTEQHLKNIEEGIPYLKPKNKIEKFGRDLSVDATELFLPGKLFKAGKYAFSPLRSFGIATAANLGGLGVLEYTGDENKADLAKSGIMLLGSLFNPQSAKQSANDLYKEAEKLLPQGAAISTNRLNKNLSQLESQIFKKRAYKDLADSEKFVIDEINKIKRNSGSGIADVATIQAQKRSLNETLKNYVYSQKDPESKSRAKNLAKNLNGYLRDTLEEYGKSNPEWWKIQSAADKAHGVIAESNFIRRALEKFMKGKPESLAHIFGIGIPAGISWFSPMTGGLTALGYQTAKIGTQVAKSKELRKHYINVVKNALLGNSKIVHQELDKLEDGLEKEQKKSKSRFVLLPD